MRYENSKYHRLSLLVKLLLEQGGTRKEMVDATGMNRNTIDQFVTAFTEHNLIEVVDEIPIPNNNRKVQCFKFKQFHQGGTIKTSWKPVMAELDSHLKKRQDLQGVRSKHLREGSLQDDMRAFFMVGAGPSSESPSSDD